MISVINILSLLWPVILTATWINIIKRKKLRHNRVVTEVVKTYAKRA